jgi:NAD(P)-dependent dehydrogenase (short-subunit alcohol dehydrogenase family)|tara:strand:+ start:103 stop:435 length:333 start_codon:yes stop_codon:yes gene_type:complete
VFLLYQRAGHKYLADLSATNYKTENPMTRAIIVGANSGIAWTIIEQLLNGGVVEHVTAISRSSNSDLQSRMQWIRCNYSEASIKTVCANLASDTNEFSHVFISNGVLHAE